MKTTYADFDRKKALVTGGAGDIGKNIALALDRANYDVISMDIKECEYKSVVSIVGDITDRDWVEEVLEHSSFDVLVNAAGITRDSFLHKMTDDDWDDVIAVNLTGTYNVTRTVIGGMRERNYGRIVNISSVNGKRGQFGQCNYSATKSAVHGFTMSLAQESAAKNIMVNTVSPGYIKTQMTDKMSEDIKNSIVKMIPAGRIGKPEDVTRAVLFLLHERNTYITGANIPVNGGLFTSF
jgi:acetoacetyl-CoA reductase